MHPDLLQNHCCTISACLLSYKRPANMQPIVDSLHPLEFIDEIIVWNNNPDLTLQLEGRKVRVINAPENSLCLGRFLCAREAQHSIVYVQDDDAIVRNVRTLYQAFLNDDKRITHALSQWHYPHRARYVYHDGHVALLGWGAFFKKEWLSLLDETMEGRSDTYLLQREADKFFSVLHGSQHNTLPADIKLLDYHASPGHALYLQPEHKLMTSQAVRQALALRREMRRVTFPITWNVVIPCYNYGQYLEEAVHSVLLNDADYVVTIVDDASTDDTQAIAERLSREYQGITYLRHDDRLGSSAARNTGIAAVDSLFVVMLDADDRIGPDYLFQAEQLLRSGCDVANPDAILFGASQSRWPVPDVMTLPQLLKHNLVHYCSAFGWGYWAQVDGFDEKMIYLEDYDFWIRLAEAGARIRKLPGDHFYYRQHAGSKTNESDGMQPQLFAQLRQKHSHLYARHL